MAKFLESFFHHGISTCLFYLGLLRPVRFALQAMQMHNVPVLRSHFKDGLLNDNLWLICSLGGNAVAVEVVKRFASRFPWINILLLDAAPAPLKALSRELVSNRVEVLAFDRRTGKIDEVLSKFFESRSDAKVLLGLFAYSESQSPSLEKLQPFTRDNLENAMLFDRWIAARLEQNHSMMLIVHVAPAYWLKLRRGCECEAAVLRGLSVFAESLSKEVTDSGVKVLSVNYGPLRSESGGNSFFSAPLQEVAENTFNVIVNANLRWTTRTVYPHLNHFCLGTLLDALPEYWKAKYSQKQPCLTGT